MLERGKPCLGLLEEAIMCAAHEEIDHIHEAEVSARKDVEAAEKRAREIRESAEKDAKEIIAAAEKEAQMIRQRHSESLQDKRRKIEQDTLKESEKIAKGIEKGARGRFDEAVKKAVRMITGVDE
ncbi:hypothetical protein EU522_01730 [Candidatus Thorarchaeota archaeon]|nr:MAG: hypothetical protein EU522_01730 [Candidatus Thorarchaeota archaeon]